MALYYCLCFTLKASLGSLVHMPQRQLLVGFPFSYLLMWSYLSSLGQNLAITEALWIIDHLFTFPREVDMLLSGKISITSVLYLVNRYSFLGFILGQLISIVPGTMSNKSYVLSTFVP